MKRNRRSTELNTLNSLRRRKEEVQRDFKKLNNLFEAKTFNKLKASSVMFKIKGTFEAIQVFSKRLCGVKENGVQYLGDLTMEMVSDAEMVLDSVGMMAFLQELLRQIRIMLEENTEDGAAEPDVVDRYEQEAMKSYRRVEAAKEEISHICFSFGCIATSFQFLFETCCSVCSKLMRNRRSTELNTLHSLRRRSQTIERNFKKLEKQCEPKQEKKKSAILDEMRRVLAAIRTFKERISCSKEIGGGCLEENTLRKTSDEKMVSDSYEIVDFLYDIFLKLPTLAAEKDAEETNVRIGGAKPDVVGQDKLMQLK